VESYLSLKVELDVRKMSEIVNLRTLASKMLLMILKRGCFNEKENWLDLDPIWQDPNSLDSFTDLLNIS